jgi:hypothetical protein
VSFRCGRWSLRQRQHPRWAAAAAVAAAAAATTATAADGVFSQPAVGLCRSWLWHMQGGCQAAVAAAAASVEAQSGPADWSSAWCPVVNMCMWCAGVAPVILWGPQAAAAGAAEVHHLAPAGDLQVGEWDAGGLSVCSSSSTDASAGIGVTSGGRYRC